jgi:cytochrome c553
MNRLLGASAALLFGAVAGFAVAARAADEPPPWAYGFEAPLDNTTLYTLPGSKFSFTQSQIFNRYGPADWFPEDHPTMPEIVAHGRETAVPTISACGSCHYPNGKGRPENANLTGLSYEYFVRQLMDFRGGARRTSDQRKGNTDSMAGFARAMTDEEITAAAKYFTSIPATPWITVVEGGTAPKTKAVGGKCAPGPSPTALSQDPPRIRSRERTSLVKNRMREIRTSGSVRCSSRVREPKRMLSQSVNASSRLPKMHVTPIFCVTRDRVSSLMCRRAA